MATAVRRRRGTTDQHQIFVGLLGEITVDTDKDTLIIHDGETAGGFPMARENLSNVSNASINAALDIGGLDRSKIALGSPEHVVINNGTGELSSEVHLAISRGGTAASNANDARINLGLGSMAVQNSNSVTITGGNITGITPLAIASGGTGAATAPAARSNLGAVNIAGDTMTGNLTVGTGVGSFEVGIDGGPGDDRILSYFSNGVRRWEVRVNAAPETGGNTGSDFRISRFDDVGNFLNAPFGIERETGDIILGTNVTVSSFLILNNPLEITSGGTGANNVFDARTNLGLGSLSTQDSNSVNITGGSITGITPLAIIDGGTGANNVFDARDNLVVVHRGGDTMTGSLIVGDGSTDFFVAIDGADGFRRSLNLDTNGSARWSIAATEDLETGGNDGSDFILTRNDDSGLFINAPITISRSSGDISFNGDTLVNGLLTISDSVTLLEPLAISSGGTNATTVSGARTNLNLLSRAGDTMTGDLVVGIGIDGRTVAIDSNDETLRHFEYRSTGFARWSLTVDDTAEVPPSGVQLIKLADPSVLPTGTGFDSSFSPDGDHLAVAHSSTPHITIYERVGNTFTKLPDPAITPAGSALGTAYSPESTHLAVTHLTSPRLTIYRRSGNTYTKLPNPSFLPPDVAWDPTFSPDDAFLVIAHTTSPFITIYTKDGDTFNKIPDPAVLPAGGANKVTFSRDNTHLAVAHAISPFVTIYRIDGTTFTKLSDPAVLPPDDAVGVSFSSDGELLAVAHISTPFVTIYSRSGDTFTKIADPSTLPTGDGQDVRFSPDARFMSVAHVTSPFVTVYSRDGLVFTKIADPLTLPTGTGNGVRFSPDDVHLAVAHVNTPFVTIYELDVVTPDTGSDFNIRRYDDLGVLIDSPMVITRSSGDVTFFSDATFSQDVSVIGLTTLGTPLAISSGGTGANNTFDARTNLGLGSLATQDSNTVNITGGSITGILLAIAYGGTGATTATDARTNLGAVNIAGDTMTGDLTIGTGVSSSAISIDGAAGSNRSLNFRTAGLSRWNIITSDDAESGGNVGSDFILTRNDDLGAFINAPITVARDSGNIVFDGLTSVTGDLSVSGSLSITTPLSIFNGGTGADNASDARTNLGLGSGDTPTFLGLSANGARITDVDSPIDAGDAANKAYVDSLVTGLRIVEAVQVATVDDLDTVGNGVWIQSGSGVGATLTAGSAGTTTIDGYVLQNSDRVLVKDQNAESENGIYVVSDAGAGTATILSRATDLDEPSEFENAFTFVESGSANGGTSWATTTPFPAAIDSDPVVFVQFAGAADLTGGSGIDITANEISIDLAPDSGLTFISDDLSVDPAIAGTGLTFSAGVLSVDVSQTQITEVGTLTTGTWNASPIGISFGGTGATSASTARTNLGLAIGTNVQAWDAGLDDISGLTVADGNFIVGNGSNWVAESGATVRTSLGLGTIATQDASNVTITGGSITGITDLAIADGGTGASSASTARTNLGLVIGSDVQAWDEGLDDISALSIADGNFIVGNGTDWVAESGNTARTSLGLGTGNTPTFNGLSANNQLITDVLDPTSPQDAATKAYVDTAVVGGDHGALSGLGDDDHTQYALLAGRGTGQTLTGGTASGEDLTLTSTSNATKGSIEFGTQSAYDEANVRLGIGVFTPTVALDVSGTVKFTGGLRVGRVTTATNYTTLATDFIIGVTNVTSPRTITLIAAATVGTGAMQIIKDESGDIGGANIITIEGQAGEDIDGVNSVTITSPYGVVRLYSNGVEWFSI